MSPVRRWMAVCFLLGLLTGCAGGKSGAGKSESGVPEKLAPDPENLDTPIPDTFRVKFETSKGDFTVEVHKGWAPRGAKRFYAAVNAGFYDGCRFFRVMPNFIVQFGINGDPAVQQKWRESPISDDLVKETNARGTLTFATAGPGTRTTQLFVNLADNRGLDGKGFSPFGRVVRGMHVVESITSKYGERPDQGRIQTQGNEYLNAVFPDLDYIKKATIVKDGAAAAKTQGKTPAKKSPASQKTNKTSPNS